MKKMGETIKWTEDDGHLFMSVLDRVSLKKNKISSHYAKKKIIFHQTSAPVKLVGLKFELLSRIPHSTNLPLLPPPATATLFYFLTR